MTEEKIKQEIKQIRINKSRYWLGVLYPENMIDDWKENAADILQLPFAYCVHDADRNIDGEERKTHVHFIVVFPNTTTYKHALEVFKRFGTKATNTCEAAISIRHAYDYLIHDTETCRKKGKHLYDSSERITGNNFDIGAYEQISQQDKNELLDEMIGFCIDNLILDIATFYIVFDKIHDPVYFDVFKSHGALIDRVCRGNYCRNQRENEHFGDVLPPQTSTEFHGKLCPKCGSSETRKRGKTASDQQRYICKECGKSFI